MSNEFKPRFGESIFDCNFCGTEGMQWREVASDKWMPFDLMNKEIHHCPSKNAESLTRDDVLQHLQNIGFEAYIPRTVSWKFAFIASNHTQTIYFLVGKRGIDLKFYDSPRETKVDEQGKLFTDGGEMVRNYYHDSGSNIHELVLELASRLVTNTPIDKSLLSGQGVSWQDQKLKPIRNPHLSVAHSPTDEMIEIHEVVLSDDGKDTIVEAIQAGTIHNGNISFDRIRGVAAKDHGHSRWLELGRGRAVLGSPEQLDQYLHSYGPMTKSQWDQFLGGVSVPAGRLRIVDYGCGQGLACALFLDHFGPDIAKRVESVILIEPSATALTRAKAVLACYCESIPVFDLNNKLDELPPEYLTACDKVSTIHLFSNVLDIDDFDYGSLFTKMFQSIGRHSVLAVSHDREFHGGSSRFRDINQQITDPLNPDYFSVSMSKIDQFICSNGPPAISWQLHFEVLNGLV